MAEPERYDVVVIGGGPAGASAALRAAALGAKVIVLEPAPLGGTCVNSGCVPTRVLARAARLVRDARSADGLGITVPAVVADWRMIADHVRARIDDLRAMQGDADHFAAAGVTLVQQGKARFVDPYTVEVDGGRRFTAEKILVCVGGHAKRLPIPGAEFALLPEEVLDLDALPDRVAVIGAGNTGTQLATVFAGLGSKVSLLDLAPRILMACDADVAAEVAGAFTGHGVDVRCGIDGATRLQRSRSGAIDLTVEDDGAESTLEVDSVVMCTGWPADLGDLGLERAGLEIEHGALRSDASLRTKVPHIFSAGDANGRDMLEQAARFEGAIAAENAVLGTSAAGSSPLLPAGGFTDPDYADVGLTEDRAREQIRGYVTATVRYDDLDRAVNDERPAGMLKLIVDHERKTVLGAHAVGENAVEVVQALTTAMAAGAQLSTLADVRFAFPTYTAIIGKAARAALAGS